MHSELQRARQAVGVRLFSVDVGGLDPEVVSDICWSAGAAGIWEADSSTWRVGVDDADVAAFVAAAARLNPRDVTDSDAVELATRDVVVDGMDLSVPPTVFGAGDHPTTAGCLAAVDAVVRPDQRVVDVGSGTGVLAIAAARAGAVVTAIDVDPVAVAATVDNAAANAVAVDASTRLVSELPGPFDVVLANITAGTIRPLLVDLVRLTDTPGVLITSGILEEQWPDIRAELESLGQGRFGVVTTDVRDGWVTATLRAG